MEARITAYVTLLLLLPNPTMAEPTSITWEDYQHEKYIFDMKRVVDDSFKESYGKMLDYHLQQKLGDDMRKHLERLKEQTIKEPIEFESKWISIMQKRTDDDSKYNEVMEFG